MFYGLKIKANEDGTFEASSRDIPECIYDAPSKEEAVKLAGDMMPGTMELFYRKKKLPIPLPSPVEEGEVAIMVPTRVQAKILLWNYMVENRYRVADVAKMFGVTQTQAQRYVDLTKDKASMETLDSVMYALGMQFTLTASKRP